MTNPKKLLIAGWAVSLLISAAMFMSAYFKLADWPKKAEEFAKAGYTIELMSKIAWVEIACTVLFLIPQTTFLGAVLLTGYLGGATEVHVRGGENIAAPVIIGMIVWLGYTLRRPDVISRAFRKVE